MYWKRNLHGCGVDQLLDQLQQAKSTTEHQATTDQLTGLKNRRAMSTAMDQLITVGRPFACMHLDLDYFKSVNDTYGHAAIDTVLQRVADVLNTETRSTDVVARVGDEFVLLLDGITDGETLDKVAKRIITQLEVPVDTKVTYAVFRALRALPCPTIIHRQRRCVVKRR